MPSIVKTYTLESINRDEALQSDWACIVRASQTGILFTSLNDTFEWTTSIWNSQPGNDTHQVVALEDDGRTCAFLPYHTMIEHTRLGKNRVLEPISNIYSHRPGLVIANYSPACIKRLLSHLIHEKHDWDYFRLTLVEGSPTVDALKTVLTEMNLRHMELRHTRSPYVSLPARQEDYFSNLSKNLRNNLRKTEKKLEGLGEISIRLYEAEHDTATFLSQVREVEKQSWKETAESSITTNLRQEKLYESFIPKAASQGWFLGTVLCLDGEPIAYMMGFVFRGVFYSEKSSFVAKHKSLGLGAYILQTVVQELYKRNVYTFDMMGNCEEYKMKWTDATYGRTTFAVFNPSVKGFLARLRLKLLQASRVTTARFR